MNPYVNAIVTFLLFGLPAYQAVVSSGAHGQNSTEAIIGGVVAGLSAVANLFRNKPQQQ